MQEVLKAMAAAVVMTAQHAKKTVVPRHYESLTKLELRQIREAHKSIVLAALEAAFNLGYDAHHVPPEKRAAVARKRRRIVK